MTNAEDQFRYKSELSSYISDGHALPRDTLLFYAHNPDALYMELNFGEAGPFERAYPDRGCRFNRLVKLAEFCFETTGVERPERISIPRISDV
jgi:hypothetical protein